MAIFYLLLSKRTFRQLDIKFVSSEDIKNLCQQLDMLDKVLEQMRMSSINIRTPFLKRAAKIKFIMP